MTLVTGDAGGKSMLMASSRSWINLVAGTKMWMRWRSLEMTARVNHLHSYTIFIQTIAGLELPKTSIENNYNTVTAFHEATKSDCLSQSGL